MRAISALDVRARFGQILDEAAAGERFVVERAGQPVAAIVPLRDLDAIDPHVIRARRLAAVDQLIQLRAHAGRPIPGQDATATATVAQVGARPAARRSEPVRTDRSGERVARSRTPPSAPDGRREVEPDRVAPVPARAAAAAREPEGPDAAATRESERPDRAADEAAEAGRPAPAKPSDAGWRQW